MKRIALSFVILGAAGCGAGSSDNSSQEELQALLHDEPLAGQKSAQTGAGLSPDAGIIGGEDGGGFGGPDGGGFTGPDAGIIGDRDGGGIELDAGLGDGGGFGALGSWSFDDCNPGRTNLGDSSPSGNTAFRAVNVACATGISGQAVSLSAPNEDIITVPDQPNFLFNTGVTVAGWFNPSSIQHTSSLIRKRQDDSSAFVLAIHGGRYRFVVDLGPGRAAVVSSRDRAVVGRWTHVAATYDGAMLRLYVDGLEVGSTRVRSPIRNSSGPILMGNDGTHRLFRGQIDNAFLDARALTPEEINQLLCVRNNPSISATPLVSAPTLPGTPANYDVVITNNDSPQCGASDFLFAANIFQNGLDVQPGFLPVPQLAAGGSTNFTLSATADDTVDPGTITIPFQVFSQNTGAFASTSVDFVLADSGCRVRPSRELMITNPSVVDDPLRTTGAGSWTFRHLVESMAPTPGDAPAMVEAMLTTFTVPQTINGFTVNARPGMQAFILANWPRINGELDLSAAPFTLQAIVNRLDLQNPAQGDAGEGRFVFAFNAPGGTFPLEATMIFEYKLPIATRDGVNDWAQAWHALGGLPFPSEEYNAALELITERFAGRGARPGATNGSAINSVRTNEIDLGDNRRWELREFRLSPVTGRLAPSTLERTPDLSFNGTDTLASFVNANESSILSETHEVPASFQGSPFAAGAVFNDLASWIAPGIANNEARFRFSQNTCNGCHSPETNTFFLQITPRFPGGEAFLSSFLVGTTVFDPVTGAPRSLNELSRRTSGLRTLVCP